MQADPSTGNVTNSVVCIDDSGNLNPATQNSRRYCNKLAVVEVGTARYLVAGFAKHDTSVLRLYELSALMAHLNSIGAGFGWPSTTHPLGTPGSYGHGQEIAATYQAPIGARPGMTSNPAAKVYGGSWLQGLAVDVEHRGTVGAPLDIVNLYVAMDCHGLARVRLTEHATNPNQLTLSSPQWGPRFGDGSHYPNTIDPATYGNWGVVDLSKSHTYNELVRNDPPHFLDVAVERRVGSGPDKVFVYAACDHLGWVRFALDATGGWHDTVTLDHHEGLARSVRRYPEWVLDAEKTNIQGPSTLFDKTQFEHNWYGDAAVFVPVDQPPIVGDPGNTAQQEAIAERDYAYAKQLVLVDAPPAATGIQEKLLVVTYTAQPTWRDSTPDAPWHTFGHIFDDIGGTSLTSFEHVRPRGGAFIVTSVYDTGDLSSGQLNFIGYIQHGGVLHVPADQTGTPQQNTLRIVHSAGAIPDPDAPPTLSTSILTQACLTYFQLSGTAPVGEPFFLRPVATNYGKRTNGIGWTIVDPAVLVTADNDGGHLEHEGVLHTGGTNLEFDLLSAATPGMPDARLQVGLTVPHESQFVTPSGELVTTGYGRGVGWNFRSHGITGLPGPLTGVTLLLSRGTKLPVDRWVRTGREAYATISNTRGDYDTWVTGQYFTAPVWQTNPGTDPPWGNADTGLLFLTVGSTVEGLTVARRDYVWQNMILSGSGAQVDWPEPEPAALNSFAFNAHPEWNGLPFRALLDAGPPTSPSPSQQTCEDEIASAAWKDFPPLREFALCLTWAPEVIRVPASPNPRWFIAVPCHTLTRSTALEGFLANKNPFGVVSGVDLNNPVGQPTCLDPGMTSGGAMMTRIAGHQISAHLGSVAWRNPGPQELTDFYNHGLVQFWEITNPMSDEDPSIPSNLDPMYPHGNAKPGMKVILPAPNSAAFKVRVAELSLAGERLLFVNDFGGRVYVYDIGVLAAVEDGQATLPGAVPPQTGPWPLTWTAPARVSDALPITNVRAMDIDVFDDVDHPYVDVYVGVPEFGFYCLTLRGQRPLGGGPIGWFFDASRELLIETPGDVHDLKVRPPTPSGVPKTLLVSDGPAGFRMYGAQ